MKEVHLSIERLVLDGVALGPGDADRLVEAMENELCEILSRPGGALDLSSLAVPSLRAPEVSLEGGAAAGGRALARALVQSLRGDP